MPVILKSNPLRSDPQARADEHCCKRSAGYLERSSKTVTIGLINNMLDGALEATERQFLSLLDSASEGISVRLLLYTLPGVPRNESGARRMLDSYANAENLLDMRLDGLIVTGREPVTANLADEPYWNSFTKVVDWARDNTYSTVWSCLAAHAAVLYMDDVRRVKSDRKHSGILDCVRVSDHPLTAGTSSRFKLPHSRWNGLSEEELTARGYRVLSLAEGAGVDTFVQENKSLFVFFQGHPEYESNTLLLEYRRDVGRYMRRETDTYPSMPRDYFDPGMEMALIALEQKASAGRREDVLAEVSRVFESVKVENSWRSTAVGIYRNWLQHICAQKELRLQTGNVAVEALRAEGGIQTLAATRAVSA